MKKFALLFCISLFIISCDKSKEPDAPLSPKNDYAGTSWTAVDDIAELIYGRVCTTTVEFFDDYTCQEIEKRTGMSFGSGTFIEEGTYRLSNDSVYWTIGKTTIGGIAKGSAMVTTMGTISGGKRTYTKD